VPCSGSVLVGAGMAPEYFSVSLYCHPCTHLCICLFFKAGKQRGDFPP
jgi:hypothetical protein